MTDRTKRMAVLIEFDVPENTTPAELLQAVGKLPTLSLATATRMELLQEEYGQDYRGFSGILPVGQQKPNRMRERYRRWVAVWKPIEHKEWFYLNNTGRDREM